MSSPGYMKWVTQGKKSSDSARQTKKRKTVPADVKTPLQTIHPTAGVSSSIPVATPSPPPPATPSLLAAIRPPKGFGGSAPLTPDDRAVLRGLRESSLKLASLTESFESLHLCYEKVASSNAMLAVPAEKAKKEKEDLGSKVRELETKVSNLTSSLAVSEAATDLASKKHAEKEAEAKSKDDKISELEAKMAELLDVLHNAVVDAFNNAVSQARVLNPDLIAEGMHFTNTVKDGEIIRCVPEVDEGGEEEEDDDVVEVEAPRTATKAPSAEASKVQEGEASAAPVE